MPCDPTSASAIYRSQHSQGSVEPRQVEQSSMPVVHQKCSVGTSGCDHASSCRSQRCGIILVLVRDREHGRQQGVQRRALIKQ